MNLRIKLIAATILFAVSCKNENQEDLISVSKKAIYDTTSVYYADYENYPKERNLLPIGVFDSGTGGLTVLEAFLNLDYFNNKTGKEGSDGIPDFRGENFIYIADQANMPYGNYPSVGKSDYLKELAVKNAIFLTNKINRSKVVVIACNTATAYALKDIDLLLKSSKSSVSVVGVINAGVRATLREVDTKKPLTVGVLATVGTISSGGYQQTLESISKSIGIDSINIFTQGGLGFAESIDMEPDYIDKSAKGVRKNYRGPKIGSDTLGINLSILDVYNFDKSGNSLLVKYKSNQIEEIQLNSSGNYARYHLVNLIEKIRISGVRTPLSKIILGCTHYPYLTDTLSKVLDELKSYNADGRFLYKEILADTIEFVDPSIFTAIETYKLLRDKKILTYTLKSENSIKPVISIPIKSLDASQVDSLGNLRYDFKYGREIGQEKEFTVRVPFSPSNINKDNLERIKIRLPKTFKSIKPFFKDNGV